MNSTITESTMNETEFFILMATTVSNLILGIYQSYSFGHFKMSATECRYCKDFKVEYSGEETNSR